METGSFDWHEAGLTVGQVSERSGVAPSALRYELHDRIDDLNRALHDLTQQSPAR